MPWQGDRGRRGSKTKKRGQNRGTIANGQKNKGYIHNNHNNTITLNTIKENTV
jgi:hypothetical protein